MPFEFQTTARFYEVDRAGILFFGRFFEYCHAAYEDLLSTAFGSWNSAFDDMRWGLPLVHTDADFRGPVRMGDEVRVAISIERVGDKSITFAHDVTVGGKCVASVRMVHASISMGDFASQPIPQVYLDGLVKVGLELPDKS